MLEIPAVKPKMQRGLESIVRLVKHEKPETIERAKEVIGMVELIAEESLEKGSASCLSL
jgi:hypothetical protein